MYGQQARHEVITLNELERGEPPGYVPCRNLIQPISHFGPEHTVRDYVDSIWEPARPNRRVGDSSHREGVKLALIPFESLEIRDLVRTLQLKGRKTLPRINGDDILTVLKRMMNRPL